MEIVDEHRAPGRKRMKRHNGRIDVYWVASPEAVKAGYVPKTITLTDDPGDEIATVEIAQRCRQWWAEMLEYLAGRTAPGGLSPVGTIAWAIDRYERDEESPYKRIRASTKPGYDRSLAIIRSTVGSRRVDTVNVQDLWRWFKKWGRADPSGKIKNHRRAYGGIQLLRIVMAYGAGLLDSGCRQLSGILSTTEFPVPKGRNKEMTAEHVAAFIPKAHELGRPSLALAVALQFCCSLRQKDVIGEWIDDVWDVGLRWGEHIKIDLTLSKPTSKSNFSEVAEFDLKLLPIVMREIERIPLTSRIGPIVKNENTRHPYRQREFARRFREVARAAGIPDDVWNMDARAGAITEAFDVGAADSDVMDLGTHKQMTRGRGMSVRDLYKARVASSKSDARRAAKYRQFPTNTCPASRHLNLMADCLVKNARYQMLQDEPEHCAGSMYAVLAALWEARTALASIKPPDINDEKTGWWWTTREGKRALKKMGRPAPAPPTPPR